MSPLKKIVVEAAAKINLRLKVLGRRPDGYHLLNMLNAQVTLTDTISLEIGGSGGISCEVHGDLALNAEENSAIQAARLFAQTFHCCEALHIRVDKRIPMGAGLGGGSSDAAAVLQALSRHARAIGIDIPCEKIYRIALSIGADVPYALQGGLVWVSGIGEKLHSCVNNCLRGQPCLLFLPALHSSTAAVFSCARERGLIFGRRKGFPENHA